MAQDEDLEVLGPVGSMGRSNVDEETQEGVDDEVDGDHIGRS